MPHDDVLPLLFWVICVTRICLNVSTNTRNYCLSGWRHICWLGTYFSLRLPFLLVSHWCLGTETIIQQMVGRFHRTSHKPKLVNFYCNFQQTSLVSEMKQIKCKINITDVCQTSFLWCLYHGVYFAIIMHCAINYAYSNWTTLLDT